MDRFGLYGKVTALPGQRDALVGHLLEASRCLQKLPGCEQYIVNVVPSEPETIWVTEIWRSAQDHDASVQLDDVKAVIARARPLIAGFESIRLRPVGGKGLPVE